MEVHTLARYISESTLQEYSFVTEDPSLVAAAAMYLAMRMKKLGPWVRPLLVQPSCHVTVCACAGRHPGLLQWLQCGRGPAHGEADERDAEAGRTEVLHSEKQVFAQVSRRLYPCYNPIPRYGGPFRVFFEVATVPALGDVEADAELAVSDH